MTVDVINAHYPDERSNTLLTKKCKKITLRNYRVEMSLLNPLNADQIRDIREKFNMSRTVFAKKLRISPRTLERWEQGISQPNQQAAVLILLVMRFGDMIERIAALG